MLAQLSFAIHALTPSYPRLQAIGKNGAHRFLHGLVPMVAPVVHFLFERNGDTMGPPQPRGPVLRGTAGSVLFRLEGMGEASNELWQQWLMGSKGTAEMWTRWTMDVQRAPMLGDKASYPNFSYDGVDRLLGFYAFVPPNGVTSCRSPVPPAPGHVRKESRNRNPMPNCRLTQQQTLCSSMP